MTHNHQPPHVAGNLFDHAAVSSDQEQLETLLQGGHFHLERIVSTGQVTPHGQWLDQSRHEWVVLLSGAAQLRFAHPAQTVDMRPGDWQLIPAGCRHRVEWTSGSSATVWLALHYQATETQDGV